MGEWVESTRTLVKYACMDTQRRAAVISKRERSLERAGRDDDDAGRWDVDVYAAIEAQRREQESDEDDAEALREASGLPRLGGAAALAQASRRHRARPSRRACRGDAGAPRRLARRRLRVAQPRDSRISPSSAMTTSHEHRRTDPRRVHRRLEGGRASRRRRLPARAPASRTATSSPHSSRPGSRSPRHRATTSAPRAAIAKEPALRAALDAAAALRSPLAERLPTLRRRAGLKVRDVARRLVAVFDLDDEPRARQVPQAGRARRTRCRRGCRHACSTRWP